MEEEKSHEKRCWGCGNYYPYYTKGYILYEKEKIGYCRCEKKIIKNDGTCKNWSSNHWYKNMRKKISLKKFSELMDSLLELLQIMKEEQIQSYNVLSEKQEERLIKEYEVHDITEL